MLARLADAGIDMLDVEQTLENEGVGVVRQVLRRAAADADRQSRYLLSRQHNREERA